MKLQDFYDKRTNQPITSGQYAFNDEELENIINDSAAEATDGTATAEQMNSLQEAWCMLLARADAILQIAQDESRRLKWQMNNEIVDPSNIAENLVKVSEQLAKRYAQARDRQLKADIENVANRPTGGILSMNDSVKPHYQRNFNNQTVRRNTGPDHY